MKSLIVLLSLTAVFNFAQTKTEETKSTVNKETGDTVLTESVIISTEEDITPRSDMIVVNPLKFLLFYNLSYYHKISNSVAVGGGFQVPTLSGIDGWGINAEVRAYPSGKNLKGFYVAPNISYNYLEDLNISSVGILVGWQWFPGSEFAMGLGIGMDYYFGSDDDDIIDYDGTAPLLRFDIGYAW